MSSPACLGTSHLQHGRNHSIPDFCATTLPWAFIHQLSSVWWSWDQWISASVVIKWIKLNSSTCWNLFSITVWLGIESMGLVSQLQVPGSLSFHGYSCWRISQRTAFFITTSFWLSIACFFLPYLPCSTTSHSQQLTLDPLYYEGLRRESLTTLASTGKNSFKTHFRKSGG